MTWVCPHCAGSGNLPDGSVTIGPDGAISNYKAPTVCWVCEGVGKVKLIPYRETALSLKESGEDEELQSDPDEYPLF